MQDHFRSQAGTVARKSNRAGGVPPRILNSTRWKGEAGGEFSRIRPPEVCRIVPVRRIGRPDCPRQGRHAGHRLAAVEIQGGSASAAAQHPSSLRCVSGRRQKKKRTRNAMRPRKTRWRLSKHGVPVRAVPGGGIAPAQVRLSRPFCFQAFFTSTHTSPAPCSESQRSIRLFEMASSAARKAEVPCPFPLASEKSGVPRVQAHITSEVRYRAGLRWPRRGGN